MKTVLSWGLIYLFHVHVSLILVGSDTAINTLTDIFADYFHKLCKMFKLNLESQPGGEKNKELLYVCIIIIIFIARIRRL